MRYLLAIFLFTCFFASCESSKQTVSQNDQVSPSATVDTIRIENKELEYEIIILEMGFESWLATQRSPNFFTQATLESRNKFNVKEWNRRVMMPNGYNSVIYTQQINYDETVDYGMEVNYLLYMYFEFFQQKYNQRLY